MAKAKTKNIEPAKQSAAVCTFESATGDKVGLDEVAAGILDEVRVVQATVLSNAENLTANETLLAAEFFKELGNLSKTGADDVRERAETVAKEAGGKFESELGSIAVTEVSATTSKAPTEKTVELLESKGLLNRAVVMSAVMHKDIDVEAMPDAELDILRKYFEIEFTPSMERINALVSLGAVKASEIDATLEEMVSRKASTRMTLKPSEKLRSYFGIEDKAKS